VALAIVLRNHRQASFELFQGNSIWLIRQSLPHRATGEKRETKTKASLMLMHSFLCRNLNNMRLIALPFKRTLSP
jgi:hypothetical protein